MSNEPKAGMSIDPEMLAAYIDKRLSPAQRAEVEAQLAADPDSYALLVDSMKALDAIDTPVPVPVPRKRTAVIVATWLAAAAAIVLIVWTTPRLLDLVRGNAVDVRYSKLVAAVGEERYFEPRVTGGFKYAPLPPVTRGSTPAERNFSVLAAVGEIQKSVEDTAESQHAWGVAQLVAGRYDDAIRSLERALLLENQASIQSDLAAAYAARAQQQSNARDWALALEHANAAIAMQPDLVEALFNRALSLERLSIRGEAQKAWQDYLKADPNSGWSREARTKLNSPISSWEKDRLRLDAATTDDVADSLIKTNPQLVREWAEDTLLKQWAVAVLAKDTTAADRALLRARSVIGAVANVQGDTLAGDAVALVEKARHDERLARAQVDFLEARRLYLEGQFGPSADRYQQALPVFTASRNPNALWAQLYLALRPYFSGRLAEAHANLSALSGPFQSSGYAIVEGRRLWTLGIIDVGRGRFDDAIRAYRGALGIFERVNESEGIAGVQSALAEVLRELGDESWWDFQLQSSRALPLLRLNRRHVILLAGTQGSLSEGLNRVARDYQEENLRNAEDGGRMPIMMAESFQWMYAVEQRLPTSATAATLGRARQWMATITDADIRQRQEAELAGVEAGALVQKDPASAVRVAQVAIDQFSREGRARRLPQLYLESARALYRTGDRAAALQALNAGLSSVEQQRVNLQEARLRLSYYEDKWNLIEEGIAEQVSADHSGIAALEFLDRWRRPVLLPGASHRQPIADALKTVPSNVAVLVYAATPDRLSIWAIRHDGVTHASSAVPRAQLDASILGLKDSMRSSQSLDERLLAAISAQLLSPVAGQLRHVEEIVVVPDGLVGEVPFAALPWPAAKDRVLDRAAVTIAPSVADAIAVATRRSAFTSADHALIAAVAQSASNDLPALTGAPIEAERVAALYGSNATLKDGGVTVDEFRALSSTASVIHLATHATANPLLPHLSRVYLSPSAAFPEGALTAAEIGTLQLPGSLVILAGCSTASGSATRSEGVIGLASAFLGAGASAVVASLWPMDDRLSIDFQEQFHTAIRSGTPVAQALRRAQLWTKATSPGQSDAFWATWTLTETSHATSLGGTQ